MISLRQFTITEIENGWIVYYKLDDSTVFFKTQYCKNKADIFKLLENLIK